MECREASDRWGGGLAAPLDRAAFQSDLRQFRVLREELSEWSSGFEKEHGRRPTMQDVRNTRVDFLISRFEAYARLRREVLRQAPLLRNARTATRTI